MATAFLRDASLIDGFGSSGHHVQRLRNHRVGNTWITLSSAPLLHTLISISKSVGAASRIPQRHRNTDLHRICRCRAVRIRDPYDCDVGWYLSGQRRDMHSADTYINTSYTSESACCPSSNNTP